MSLFSFTATGFTTLDQNNIENMPPRAGKAESAKLYAAENVVFTKNGAIRTRKGFTSIGVTGGGARVDEIFTHVPYDVLFAKCGTGIYHSLDGITWYSVNTTRTAGEIDTFHSIDKDVHVSNQTDNYIRIAVSTLAEDITTGSTSFDIRAGDGGKFTDGVAKVYIEGDEIDYNGTTGDQLDSVTNISASHATGAIVTQVSTVSTTIKGNSISDAAGQTLISGVADDPYAVFYSVTKTRSNPELAYDYAGAGSGTQYMQSPVLQLAKVSNQTVIIMKDRMRYTTSITDGTNGITDAHGGLNSRCAVQGDRFLYVMTNTHRIIPLVVDDQGTHEADKSLADYKKLDYPIRNILAKMDADQTRAFAAFDSTNSTVEFTIFIDGVSQVLKLQEDVGAWSIDTGKNHGCKTVMNNVYYAGSDNGDVIYQDNEGVFDDTSPIVTRILTGILSMDERRITFDVLNFILGGLLSGNGQFTLRLYFSNGENQSVTSKTVTAADLQSMNLMGLTTGVPLGAGTIGAETIGQSGSDPEGFRFTYPLELLEGCDGIQVEIEVEQDVASTGTALEVRNFRIDAETEGALLQQTA